MSFVRLLGCLVLGVTVVCAGPCLTSAAAQQAAPATVPAKAGAVPAGTVLPADVLQSLLPATVYFQGKTAPLQLRNAAALKLGGDALLWVGLVDNSGYASDVQEKYQFYLVTEAGLHIGSSSLSAGAYGGGFLGGRFLIMDVGGHTVAEGPVQTEAELHRPRPLQLVADGNGGARLYLGRRWVLLHPDTASSAK